MVTVAAVVSQSAATPQAVRDLLVRLSSTEGRLAVTAGVLLVALTLSTLVAPFVVRRLRAALGQRLSSGRLSDAVDRTSQFVPATPGGVVLRTAQFTILFFAVVALFVVWGLADLAVDVLTLLGLSLPLLGQTATTLVLALVAYVAVDLLGETTEQFAQQSDRVTEHQKEIMLRAGRVGILAVALSTALTVWGIDLSGLLVGAGFLGVVVGLAARQTLGSLIAGFLLMFSRPFTIDDWVEIGDHQGIVAEITILNTRLENFDGEMIVIPNDQVASQAITNRSDRGHLRIRLDVDIDYETDPERAAKLARETMNEVALVTDSPPPRVVRKSFGDSAIVLELRFWIEQPMPPRKWQAIDEVIQGVKTAFDAGGVKIPFPQRELSGRAGTGRFRLADESVDGARADRPDVEPETEQ